ncbi:MAG: metallophosphoesterase family protein [Rhizobiaceae bacterium]|jgi:serine/threonine protein phosphatase 1
MSGAIDFAHARAPEGMRLYAIGDVHGCAEHLAEMHRLIAAEIERDRPRDWRIVHLGDYIDRGPDSKGVLARLIEAKARDARHIALLGNHDAGFLDFLAEPTHHGLFARFGGETTAASYGVSVNFGDPAALERGHAALTKAMPRSHIDFLAKLSLSVCFGDFFFCHAGIKPGVPLDRQQAEQLIWIRDEFLDCPTLHPKVVVHGHTPTERPEVMSNRVNIDTGCYRTSVLTALVVDGAEKRFLTVAL